MMIVNPKLLSPEIRPTSVNYFPGVELITRAKSRTRTNGRQGQFLANVVHEKTGGVEVEAVIRGDSYRKSFTSSLGPGWTREQLRKRIEHVFKKARREKIRLDAAYSLMQWVDTTFTSESAKIRLEQFIEKNEGKIGTSEYDNMSKEVVEAWRKALEKLAKKL